MMHGLRQPHPTNKCNTTVTMKTAPWDLTPCTTVEEHQCFKVNCCLHVQSKLFYGKGGACSFETVLKSTRLHQSINQSINLFAFTDLSLVHNHKIQNLTSHPTGL
jgi:hypothetical protein